MSDPNTDAARARLRELRAEQRKIKTEHPSVLAKGLRAFGAGVGALWRTAPKALIGVIVLAFLGGMIWGGVRNGGEVTIIQFAEESALFGLQAMILTLFALAVVYVSQLIRSMEWFDKRGASREMKKVQDRAGTEHEKPGDSIALGIQVAGTTLLIGMVLLAYFLIHDTGGSGTPAVAG